MLEFMYTAKLTLSPQNVEDVLAVANFLQMQEIVNACSAYQSMANPAPSVITLDFTVGEFPQNKCFHACELESHSHQLCTQLEVLNQARNSILV